MKKSILLIDDSPFICTMVAEYFKEQFEVHIAENGMEALHFIHEKKIPSLIISDINMPEMSGVDFFKTIQMSSVFNSIPMIILSANDNSQDKIDCLKLGALDFVTKPFNPEELRLRAQNIIRITS